MNKFYLVHRTRYIPKKGVLIAGFGESWFQVSGKTISLPLDVAMPSGIRPCARQTLHFCLNSVVESSFTAPLAQELKILVVIELTEDLKQLVFGTPQDMFMFTSHFKLRRDKDFVLMPEGIDVDSDLAPFIQRYVHDVERAWFDFAREKGARQFRNKRIYGEKYPDPSFKRRYSR